MTENKNNDYLELQELKSLSASMGKDKTLIQGSGGNTSIKIDNKLFVKASGTMLKNADKEDMFLSIKLDSIVNQLNEEGKLDKDLDLQIANDKSLKPSIETAFHAFIPHKVVLHSHALDAIIFTVSPKLKINLKKILKNYSWELINYARPGYPLANLIIEAFSKRKVNVLILQNHGLIVGADTVMQAKQLQDKIISLLKIKSRNIKSPNLSILKNISLKIPSSKLPVKTIIHSLATDKWSFELVKRKPLYPDHVIFCGKDVLILDPENIKLENLKSYDYVLIPKYGVIILKENSEILEVMLEMQAVIFSKLKMGTKTFCLSEFQCNELLNWEAEKYRQKIITN